MDAPPETLPTNFSSLLEVENPMRMLVRNKYYLMKDGEDGNKMYLVQSGPDAPRANNNARPPRNPEDHIGFILLKRFHTPENEWRNVPARRNGTRPYSLVNVSTPGLNVFYTPGNSNTQSGVGRHRKTRKATKRSRHTRRRV